MTQPHTVHSFIILLPTPTPSLPSTHQRKLHPPLSQDIIQLSQQQHKPQYPPTAHTDTPPPPTTHTHTHTHPATQSSTTQWTHTKSSSISSNSVNNVNPAPVNIIVIIQFCQHPSLPPPPTPTPYTHMIHWPNQHPTSTTHTHTLTHPHSPPSSDPTTYHHYQNMTVIQLIAHPAPVKTYQVIIQIIQLCQQSPQSTDLTTPSQHHPHPANTLIQPHSPTGLDISGNYSLPTFFRNFTFFNIDYIDGLVQNCSFSIANALEILHSCTKPSIFDLEDNVAQIHLPGWQFYLHWLSEWVNLTAFLGTADSEVHIVHISHEQLIWNIWTSLSAVPRKAVKFNHSLDRQAVGYIEPCLITQSTCIVNQLITHPTHTPPTHTHPFRQQHVHLIQTTAHSCLDGASNVWAFSVRTQSIWCYSSTSQIFSHFMLSPYRTSEPQQLLDRDYTIIITVKPLIKVAS